MKQEKDLTGEIVIYQPDETIRLEVKIEDETVWLSQQPLNGPIQSSTKSLARARNPSFTRFLLKNGEVK